MSLKNTFNINILIEVDLLFKGHVTAKCDSCALSSKHIHGARQISVLSYKIKKWLAWTDLPTFSKQNKTTYKKVPATIYNLSWLGYSRKHNSLFTNSTQNSIYPLFSHNVHINIYPIATHTVHAMAGS